MSFTWKVEDLALMNEKSKFYIGNEKVYKVEDELTRQEKIEFLDSMNDGLTSYILNLADKLEEDKENGIIKKDIHGEMKTISYIAWINKNDTRNCLGTGTFDMGITNFSPGRNINRLKIIHPDYVDEAFHLQLKDLERQEKQYFRKHDEYEILKRKVSNGIDKYGAFGLNILQCSEGLFIYKRDNFNLHRRELTLDELKFLNNKYEELEKYYKKITSEMPQIDYEHEYNFSDLIDKDKQDNKQEDEPVIDLD